MFEIVINQRFTEKDFEQVEAKNNEEICIDCSDIHFLTSKEISRLLICITKKNNSITLTNINDHIRNTIEILKLKEYFQMK